MFNIMINSNMLKLKYRTKNNEDIRAKCLFRIQLENIFRIKTSLKIIMNLLNSNIYYIFYQNNSSILIIQ